MSTAMRLLVATFLVVPLAALGATCGRGADVPVAPAAEPAPAPQRYRFTDVTAASGLGAFEQRNGGPEKRFVLESFGAGVALFDADGDGDMDAYLTNAGELEGASPERRWRDALFTNDGRGHFTDGTSAAGLGDESWTTGVRTVDLDSDGDTELYLTNYGPNVLYDNRGEGRFVDVSAQAGVGDPGWSTGAGFLDFDHDGDLDLFVGNYLEFDREAMLRERPRGTMNGHSQTVTTGKPITDVAVMKGPMGLEPSADRFYRNDGAGRFHDASAEVGIADVRRFSFQVLVFDADLDGWLDVLVVNDVVEDSLWKNQQGKSFREDSLRAGMAVREDGVPQGGMGGAVGDYDGDLMPDLWISNYVQDYSTLFRGLAGGFFKDVTGRFGPRRDTWSMVGWGCDFVDFDSDGDLELFQVNGHVYPQVDQLDLGTRYRQESQLWELVDGRYVLVEGDGGPDFRKPRAARGTALGDVDGDGDMDLLVGCLDQSPTLLRNDSVNGHWLKLRLVGTGTRDAIGARVVLAVGERKEMRLVGTGNGFLSSSDPRLHFGLGTATRAGPLEVTWPDGRVERFEDLEADRLYTIEDGGPGGTSSLRQSLLGGP